MRSREWLISFLFRKMRPEPGKTFEMAQLIDGIERASGKDAKVMDALSRVAERAYSLSPVAARIVIEGMSGVSPRVQGPAHLMSALGVASHVLGAGVAGNGIPEEICQALLCTFQGLKKIGENVCEPQAFEEICGTAYSLEEHFLVSKYVSYMGDAAAHIGGAIPSVQVLSRQAKAVGVQAEIGPRHAEGMISRLAIELRKRTEGPA